MLKGVHLIVEYHHLEIGIGARSSRVLPAVSRLGAELVNAEFLPIAPFCATTPPAFSTVSTFDRPSCADLLGLGCSGCHVYLLDRHGGLGPQRRRIHQFLILI